MPIALDPIAFAHVRVHLFLENAEGGVAGCGPGGSPPQVPSPMAGADLANAPDGHFMEYVVPEPSQS